MQPSDLTGFVQEYLAAREAGGDCDSVARRLRADHEEFGQVENLIHDLEGAFDLLNESSSGSLPERIGRFRPLRQLGQGGFSSVFLAQDSKLERLVALKVLAREGWSTGGQTDWIAAEGRSLAQLRHPDVVQVFDLDEADGTPFVAMEYVAGTDLRAVLEALRKPHEEPDLEVRAAVQELQPIAARCRLVARLARALSYCHENGVIHRDVTPGNVLLTAPAEPKWIDFGLAHFEDVERQLELTQGFVGTPAYLAPEQVDRKKTGASALSDMFSLASVFYELLTLTHPFKRETYAGTMAAISRANPKLLRSLNQEIPADIERICLHALERRPEDRYPTTAAFADDIEAFLEHRAISLRAPLVSYSLHLWGRRNRRRILGTAAVILAVWIPLLGAWFWSASNERQQTRAAATTAQEQLLAAVNADSAWFTEYIQTLSKLQDRADENDRGFASLLFADNAPVVHELWVEVPRRMEDCMLQEQALIQSDPGLIGDDRRQEPLSQFKLAWGHTDTLRTALSPLTEERLTFGSLNLPPGELARRTFVECVLGVAYEPVRERAALESGWYRFTTTLAGEPQTSQVEFEVTSNEYRYSPPLNPIPAWLAEDWYVVPTGRHATDECTVDIPAFEMTKKAITWGDVDRVFTDTAERKALGLEMVLANQEFDVGPNRPAILPWTLAQEFALRVGARLPTSAEAWLAASSPEWVEDLSTYAGTWTSVCSGREARALDHVDLEAGVGTSELLMSLPIDAMMTSICFRLVRPVTQ